MLDSSRCGGGHSSYIHIACVTIGFVIPLVPVIAIMTNYALEFQSIKNCPQFSVYQKEKVGC